MGSRFAAFGLQGALACLALVDGSAARAQAMVPMAAPASVADAALDRARAIQCMALAIGYEAGRESKLGQQAVGEVILNRTGNPAYPKSVCGVVFEGSGRRTGCQFTFTCDGAMRRALPVAVREAARATAEEVVSGAFVPQVAGATHYHANYVSPYWAPTLVRVGKIGAHIFYRTPSGPNVAAAYLPVPEPAPGQLGSILFDTDPATQGARRGGYGVAPARAQASAAVFSPWGLAAALPPGH